MITSVHYKPKKISEINPKTDQKIALIGKIVEITPNNSFILDDETAKAEIFFDKDVELDQTIRVFCSIEDNYLKADIVQSINGFDLDLFKKVEELYRKAGV